MCLNEKSLHDWREEEAAFRERGEWLLAAMLRDGDAPATLQRRFDDAVSDLSAQFAKAHYDTWMALAAEAAAEALLDD